VSDVRLFFGVGAGRCGTMAIANALAAEPGVCCTHEGKRRHGEEPGEQLLPFLTLENRIAYEWPDRAGQLFTRLRGDMPRIATRLGVTYFGDIAYNYAPFIGALSEAFPAAKLFVLVRNGVDFVRSATQAAGEDRTPVGWPPLGKALSAVERYVELGRLAPREREPLAARWESLDHLARNAWLWAETNRVILAAIALRPAGSTCVLRFEEFFRDLPQSYASLRQFLGLPGDPAPEALATFSRPINRRVDKMVGGIESWDAQQRDYFEEFAGAMMRQLGYA
jgi:hypothetical protein